MRRDEHGKSTVSGFLWLLVLGATLYAAWNVGPAYFANFMMQDKMIELARVGRSTNPDSKIRDGLMKEVNDQGLAAYINRADFVITTSETSRRIVVEYDREVKILPGFSKVIHFTARAEGLVAF